MKKIISMREALTSPDYFGSYLTGDSWAAWRVLLIAIMGEELTPAERELFKTLTAREREPGQMVAEFWGIIGRRGGKSRAVGVLCAFLAGCCDHRDVLAPGQRGRLPIVAAARKQADEVLSYIAEALARSPALSPLLDGPIVDRTLSLKSRVDIEVYALSWRTLRSGTAVAVVADEVAFWRSDESATPDREVMRALRPWLATTEGPLVAISSPYAKAGVLYEAFTRDYGPAGRPAYLVAKGPTTLLHPTISKRFLAQEEEGDPVAFDSEYGAEFRGDVSSFIPREKVEAAVVTDRDVLPRVGKNVYHAFVDASGSSMGNKDAMTLAIAHKEESGSIILDNLIVRKPPFKPSEIVPDFAGVLKQYGCTTVVGDHWGGEWVKEPFRLAGITYEQSKRVRSDIYREFLPLLLSGNVELLDVSQLSAEMIALERKTSPSGKDSINHPKAGHDDAANAACGALLLASDKKAPMKIDRSQIGRLLSPSQSRAGRTGFGRTSLRRY